MRTIQEIAAPILGRSQDLSDLQAGDQVVCLYAGPDDWDYPLLAYPLTIDEASEDTLSFRTSAGPDFKHYFDRQGGFKGLSWQDATLMHMWADHRLYRWSPEIEYLLLWRKLFSYLTDGWDALRFCSNEQIRELHQALHWLNPQQFESEPQMVEAMLVLRTEYYLRHGDSSMTSILANARLHDLAQVRAGMYVAWGHEGMFGWRLCRIKVSRTTKQFIWVGEPEVARKFDRRGNYRNQTCLDSSARWQERNDLLFLITTPVKELLARQQLLGDIYSQHDLLRKLSVEDLAPLYQLLKTFLHEVEARQDDTSREREIDQRLDRVAPHESKKKGRK